MEYEASLDRALEAVPDIDSDGARLSVPDPAAQADGAPCRAMACRTGVAIAEEFNTVSLGVLDIGLPLREHVRCTLEYHGDTAKG